MPFCFQESGTWNSWKILSNIKTETVKLSTTNVCDVDNLRNNGSSILASPGHVTLRLQQVLNPVLAKSNFSYMNDTEILTLFFTIDNSG